MKRGWWRNSIATAAQAGKKHANLGTPMLFDHRRILATAIARLRGKLKYRPVVFELMAPTFTLLELQRAVEALGGLAPAQAEFPPPGGGTGAGGGYRTSFPPPPRGRPAELFRFRREVLRERPAPGMRLGARRTRIGWPQEPESLCRARAIAA